MRHLLLFLFFGLVFKGIGQEFIIEDFQESTTIDSGFYLTKDKGFDKKSILNGDLDSLFIAASSPIVFENSMDSFWVRFDFINNSNQTDYTVLFGNTMIYDFRVFQNTTLNKVDSIGFHYNTKKQISGTNLNYFELMSEPGKSHSIYVKVNPEGMAQILKWKLIYSKRVLNELILNEFLVGLFYGVLFVVFLINVFYFMTTRNAIFLYYGAYVFLTILFGGMTGSKPIFYMTIFGGSANYIHYVIILSYFSFLPILAHRYLELKLEKKWFMRLIYLPAAITLFSSLTLIISGDAAFYFKYGSLVIFLCIGLVLNLAVLGLKRNKLLGLSFAIAFLIISFTSITATLMSYGIIDSEIGLSFFDLGIVIEIIILSLALAFRFSKIEKESSVIKENLNELESEKELVTIEKEEFESMALRLQMNPHFIFNALNSINGYILLNERDKSSEYLIMFARLMRTIMEKSSTKSILLEDELNLLKDYINLENLRLGNSINYSLKLDSNIDCDFIYIPSMIVQPYIENAIIHGLSQRAEGAKLIVEFELYNDNAIKVTISDNGIGRAKSRACTAQSSLIKKSKGLLITKLRLEKLSQFQLDLYKVVTIDLSDDELYPGTKVELIVPILEF